MSENTKYYNPNKKYKVGDKVIFHAAYDQMLKSTGEPRYLLRNVYEGTVVGYTEDGDYEITKKPEKNDRPRTTYKVSDSDVDGYNPGEKSNLYRDALFDGRYRRALVYYNQAVDEAVEAAKKETEKVLAVKKDNYEKMVEDAQRVADDKGLSNGVEYTNDLEV